MSKLQIPLSTEATLMLGETPHRARVLDATEDAVLILLSDSLDGVELPSVVILSYGHDQFLWEAPLPVLKHAPPYMLAELPDDLACRRFQRRNFSRIAYQTVLMAIPTTIDGEQIGPPVSLQLLNVGASGCLTTSAHHVVSVGSHMMLLLALPGLTPMPISAEVIRQGRKGRLFTYGIQFKNLKGASLEHLTQFVAQRIQTARLEGLDIVESDE